MTWGEAGPPPGHQAGYTADDPPEVRRRARAARRRRRRLTGFVLVAVVSLLAGFGVGYVRGYFSDGRPGATVTVVIPEGATLNEIAAILAGKGVVPHARAFVIRAEADGYGTKFKPGTYRLRENEPYDRLVALLLKGAAPHTVRVTIPEGMTLAQTAALVARRLPGVSEADYLRVARDHPPRVRLGGYRPGTTLEGLLFPATYEVTPDTGARRFVQLQLDAFRERLAQVDLRRARAANLTPYDVVIIASLVEREAKVAAERPLVAAVIWNRLRRGMLLQIDATVQYALGETKPVLTYDDLKVDSPYNTYLHPGLPPTPIANPGLAALKAAADPAPVDYLYYVLRNDGSGRHYFSATYEQFLADKAKAAANAP